MGSSVLFSVVVVGRSTSTRQCSDALGPVALYRTQLNGGLVFSSIMHPRVCILGPIQRQEKSAAISLFWTLVDSF